MLTKTTYCQCGAMIKLTADSTKALDGAMAIWWREHQGDGHGPATRAQALAARERNEYEADNTNPPCPVCGAAMLQTRRGATLAKRGRAFVCPVDKAEKVVDERGHIVRKKDAIHGRGVRSWEASEVIFDPANTGIG